MDYKELVEQLRSIYAIGNDNPDTDGPDHCGGCSMCDVAADAIEALLAERDAAVEQLSNDGCRCCSCIYYNRTLNDHPCNHCKETGGMTDYWQWRGLQKEGGS